MKNAFGRECQSKVPRRELVPADELNRRHRALRHRVVRPEGMPPRVEVEVFGHLDPYHVMTAMYGRYSINGLKS